MVHRRLRAGAPTAAGAPIRNQSTKVNQMTAQVHNEDLSFTVHVFKEGDVFIAYVPQLDVSSCGDTATAARRNIQDAVSLLLETSKERGTLTEILEEAGYRHEGRHWLPPEHISLDRLSVNLPA